MTDDKLTIEDRDAGYGLMVGTGTNRRLEGGRVIDKLREALDRAETSFWIDELSGGDFESLVAAARAYLDGETIQWCEVHRSRRFWQQGQGANYCEAVGLYSHLQECRMVSRRLVVEIEEN